MELLTVSKKTIIPGVKQYKNLPLFLVEKLLTTILSNEDEELLVEGDSQNFVYDANSDIQVGELLSATVLGVRIKQQEGTIEISLSGNIETADGFQQSCNLYFYMWWDRTQPSPLENQGINRLKPVSIRIHPENLSEKLSDSVFELDLYRKNSSQRQEYLGQGRGYLVFGRTN